MEVPTAHYKSQRKFISFKNVHKNKFLCVFSNAECNDVHACTLIIYLPKEKKLCLLELCPKQYLFLQNKKLITRQAENLRIVTKI